MNLSTCDSIDNASASLLCSYIYYYNAAPRLNNASYCSYLPDQTNHTLLTILETKDSLNLTSAADTQFMTVSELNITTSAACYYNTAVLTKNRTLCSYSGTALAPSCYDYFNTSASRALNFTSALALCKEAPYGTNGICYYALYTEKAIAQRNLSSCLAIENSTYQNTCIVELASNYNDSSYCSAIANNTTDQQACVSSATYKLK